MASTMMPITGHRGPRGSGIKQSDRLINHGTPKDFSQLTRYVWGRPFSNM